MGYEELVAKEEEIVSKAETYIVILTEYVSTWL